MADYTPVYTGGVKPFSLAASAAVTGGQLVVVSGAGTVANSAATSALVVGVAAHDAASGGRVSVWPLANCIHEVPVGTGTVTAGDGVVSAAAQNGSVISAPTSIATQAAAGTLIGIALTTATATNKVRFIGRS